MKKKLIIFSITILTSFLLSTLATAYEATFTPTADTWVDSTVANDTPAVANPQQLFVGHNNNATLKRRSYLRFDLTIPDGLVVESAVLRLYVNKIVGANDDPIDANFAPDNDAWTRNTLTWNEAINWSTIFITTNPGPFISNSWTEWDVLSAVQSTYLGDKKLTIELKSDEVGSKAAERFFSMAGTYAPQLTVKAVPEPATVLLLMTGLMGMGLGRKKLL
ncbi:MAG: DNRLRE domain-containing protein [bacterium]